MPTYEYYFAKTIELKRRLDWVGECLSLLDPSSFTYLQNYINEWCQQLKKDVAGLDRLVQVGRTSYIPRARELHLLIESKLNEITSFLLSPLLMLKKGIQQENLRAFLLRLCQECKHNIPTDCVPFLGNPPAVVTAVGECPIFHLPHEITHSMRWWPSLFHEVGHLVVNTDRLRIIGTLVNIVNKHINNKIIDLGPVSAKYREDRIRALEIARQYWTTKYPRLEELFCDCFAAYCCGLGYLYFWLDYCICFIQSPSEIYLRDVHPPASARFSAAYQAIDPVLKISNEGKRLQSLWNDYLITTIPGGNMDSQIVEYELACSEKLISELAEASINIIQGLPGSLKRYNKLLPNKNEALKYSPDARIADLINAAVAILLQEPTKYLTFEDYITSSVIG